MCNDLHRGYKFNDVGHAESELLITKVKPTEGKYHGLFLTNSTLA